MISDFQYSILIVEGDSRVKQTIASIIADIPVIPVFSDTGEAAVKYLKTTDQAPSVIISALSLEGMGGTAFLEHAKKTVPNSIRYLMAARSEMETLVNAVNQRAVHRFFVKPFENRDFLTAVHNGLKLYDSIREHKQLLKLAKHQNARLYDLNCELVDVKKEHNQTVQSLDVEIKTIRDDITGLGGEKPMAAKELEALILSCVDSGEGVDVEKLEALFSFTVQTLFNRFEDLAFRNGFELMPPREDLE